MAPLPLVFNHRRRRQRRSSSASGLSDRGLLRPSDRIRSSGGTIIVIAPTKEGGAHRIELYIGTLGEANRNREIRFDSFSALDGGGAVTWEKVVSMMPMPRRRVRFQPEWKRQLLLASALLLLVMLLPLLSEFCKQPLFSAPGSCGRSIHAGLWAVAGLCWLVCADRRIFRIFFDFSVKSSVFHHRYIILLHDVLLFFPQKIRFLLLLYVSSSP